jgi:hypothetical protein
MILVCIHSRLLFKPSHTRPAVRGRHKEKRLRRQHSPAATSSDLLKKTTENAKSDIEMKNASYNQVRVSIGERMRSILSKFGDTQRLLMLFTAALALVAVQQCGISGRQLGIMKIDERAAMQYETSGFLTTPEANKLPVFVSQLLNIGKTPALNLNVHTRIQVVRADREPNFSLSNPEVYSGFIGAFLPQSPLPFQLGVTDHTSIPTGRCLTPEEVTGLQDGRYYLAMVSRVTFDDVFGDHHWMNVCGFKGYKVGINLNASECARFNSMDTNGLIGFQHPLSKFLRRLRKAF